VAATAWIPPERSFASLGQVHLAQEALIARIAFKILDTLGLCAPW
jgi:hypothetical protein